MPTILELFKGKEKDKAVKADRETFIEQETSGIRISSAVEVNNPLIYGNEATRIALRSTPLLEDIKSNANGGTAGGGLIGGKINQARDFVNSTIGIPEAQTPSRLVDKIDGTASNDNPSKSMQKRLDRFAKKNPNQVKNPHSQIPITKDIVGSNGTEVGKFLKQSGGGNPTTLGKQALGNGIGIVKDKLRNKLFGEQQTIGDVLGEKVETTYNNSNTYTQVLKDNRNYDTIYDTPNGIPADSFSETQIDLTSVSPVHGVKRGGDDFGRFGKPFGYGFKNRNNPGSRQSKYSPEVNPETGKQDNIYKTESRRALKNLRGFSDESNSGDKINLNPSSYDSIDDSGLVKIGENEYKDLVPFWIGYYGSTKPTLFRAIINGLTETVTPSWSSNNFVGNPYKYYIYESIDRGVAFNISLYCNNPLELAANWERMSTLTKYAYPSIQENLTNPPFIWFKLGDMYHKKAGIIDSLSYTMPDNGTWETDVDGFTLPKFIDIAISIKFIENVGDGSKSQLYNYKKSKEALSAANDEALKFSEESKTNSDGSIGDGKRPPLKINPRGVKISTPPPPVKPDLSGLKSLGGKVKSTVPKPSDDLSKSPVLAQSGINDTLGGKTPAESSKELESKNSITTAQANIITSYKGTADKVEIVKESQLPEGAWIPWYLKTVNSIYVKASSNDGYEQIVQVSPNGKKVLAYRTEE